jgi:hypothetical protein
MRSRPFPTGLRSLLTLAAASFLLVTSVACSGDKKGGLPAATADPETVVQDMLRKVGEVKSFRADISVQTGGSETLTAAVEVATPDKLHFTFTPSADSGQGEIQAIVLGRDAYLKLGTGWTKVADALPEALALDPRTTSKDLLDAESTNNVSPVREGQDTVDGKPCQLYTTTTSDMSSQVCISNNLPRKLVVKVQGTTITTTFHDFDGKVEIKPPV